MADKKISQLSVASTPLAGTEVLPIVQSGTTVQVSVANLTAARAVAAAALTVDANSVSDAVRITQTGTGNALLVEDSANPDSSSFVIDASGNVGIGTSSPGNKLDIASANTSQIRVKDGINATAAYDFGRDATDGFFGFSGAQASFSGYKWSVNAGTEVMRITNGGNVGIGTSSPSASAILDAQSTTKGVRFPNMTTTEKNAIATPAAGLVVFDTTLAKLCVYSGAAWQTITSV